MNLGNKIDPSTGRIAGKAATGPGGDWIAPKPEKATQRPVERRKASAAKAKSSPLTRKIVTVNLLAMIILVTGVLYQNPFRPSLVLQRETALATETRLVAGLLAERMAVAVDLTSDATRMDVSRSVATLHLSDGTELFVYDLFGNLIATTFDADGASLDLGVGAGRVRRSTFITDFLNRTWDRIAGMLSFAKPVRPGPGAREIARQLAARAQLEGPLTGPYQNQVGGEMFSAASPIEQDGAIVGVVALTSGAGEFGRMVAEEREQVLQMFVLAVLVSITLSVLLAANIANPLRDLAAAAEAGREKKARQMTPGRVRIPDLTARPDEIGRLSGAMRGMVAALYDRIEANEQFAADVSHEIKNPLASLRSAVGTLRIARRDDQRERLLDVIEHDVRRLDRLVSEISNASRLDSELVKEDEEAFDLIKMLANIVDYTGAEARQKGIDFIADLPAQPILVFGLEARLAQVFVNIIANAISFCEAGDAVRVWVRQRENRALIVVEDTGPGIPDAALSNVFKRFYSERPEQQFGNHSGLGLAISKQIVEAHGGVIWAENIRPTNADVTSEPLGARFVVGLPV